MIVITHYQRLLDHIVPDFVHVLSKGRIVKSGGKDLALRDGQFVDAESMARLHPCPPTLPSVP